ncbi:hypothetical protein [Oleiagrimonas sp.]|jgi:hypothetical protein|uniref:hypothetical protein n=1 Tax=Oleiagrimonas sp. TaxID=2010330 RepID=UPI00261AF006|nr:hypothetical protein [Oleiagrimonas sp.]MDA3914910.1 hypothetical protein [Oleiagrimonas sp.]
MDRAFALFLVLLALPVQASQTLLEQLKLPPGFHIALYAVVPNAREMARGDDGTVFAGSMNAGKV